MSGTGKRMHEEFSNLPGNAAPSVRQHESLATLLTCGDQRSQSAVDTTTMADSALEHRPPKLPRLDFSARPGESHKTSGLDDSTLEVSFGLDNKVDSRELRDSRETGPAKLEFNRDEKAVSRDFKTENHEEKGERDGGKDTSGDGRMDYTDRDYRAGWKKLERDQRSEFWNDPRELWKDHRELGSFDYRVSSQQIGDYKDSNWGKRIARKNSLEEDGEFRDPEETVGENKIDWKREDKEKERERKRKDDKLRDREDRQRDREEKQSTWRVHLNSAEKRDMDREERETGRERWEREKEKKERGREKEQDKRDHIRRDWLDKDDLESVKKEVEEFEGSKKADSEGGILPEHPELERKPSKEIDNWKGLEREEREKKRERDRDKKVENDRFEKRARDQEKEQEDGSPEEGIGERDKEIFVNYGFQQRKRMLRPRGHSQVVSRDGRSRFLPKDLDGNPGNYETTAILYRPGEYMPELTKLWKEHELGLTMKNGEGMSAGLGPTIQIRIPAKLVTTSNHQVRGSQLWGTDVYTDDSDLVAVLMHTGYYRPTASPPPPSIQDMRATIRVLAPQDSYTSTLRNNVRSRAWGAASGCSYSVERCRIMKVGGGSIELEPCLTRISAVAPTLAPAAMERTMTTRAASSNAYRQQRFVQEVTIQYNLCNEPWMKYSMSIVADRGLKKSQYTSARLRKGEVLYVETHRNRYELSYDGEKVTCNGGFGATTATSAPPQIVNTGADKLKEKENEKIFSNHNGEKSQGRITHNNDKGQVLGQNGEAFDRYKWARCRQPLPLKVMLAKGVPLPLDFIEVLEDGLAWEEIQWSQTGVWVRGKEFPLARAQFLSPNLEDLD